jgi:aspartyl-tRNA(Asn)/glutamyl-tRNA(Gln) amidotransferase subunit A
VLASLTEAATRIRRREVSARELVEWQLRQIELLDPVLHAFVSVSPEASLREADRLDACEAQGPLHGIPISVKDNIDVEGFGTTAGSPLLDAAAARRDAEAVRRLRAAGAIVIGKNALYELAFGAQSEHWSPTQNPWRLGRATAGSSSGSAAAVAAGLSFAALASDTGGSIRVPAGFCGLVGVRPTAGTIPRSGLVPLSRLDELGPLARTAEDAAAVFQVLTGRPARAAVRSSIAGLRLGACAPGIDAPEIAGAMDAARDTLLSLGLKAAARYELDLGGAASALWTIAGADAAGHWLERARPVRQLVHPLVMERIAAGAEITDEALGHARERVLRIAAELDRVFDEVDALLLPVAGCSGYPLGARSLDVAGKPEDVSMLVTRYTPIASIAGLPALVLPCGTYDDGMPLGVQLVAARGRDDLLLELACRYQQLTGWHERVPSLARAQEPIS